MNHPIYTLIGLGLLLIGHNTYANVLEEIKGDLDGDGKAEWVVVTETSRQAPNGMGKMRKLDVYKLDNGQKRLWQSSEQVVLPSQAGGMMGDPFQGISIRNGSLFIEHAGGSSWKWSYRDQYRYQNGQFELIGYQSNAGRLCDYWEDVDANLSTGKIVYRKTIDADGENCEPASSKFTNIHQTFTNKNLKLNFNNRHQQEVYVNVPNSREKIHFSSGI